MKTFSTLLGWWLLFIFAAIKLAGTSLAGWSWLWLLCPPVPLLSLAVKYWKL